MPKWEVCTVQHLSSSQSQPQGLCKSVLLPFPAFSIYTHVWPKALRLWRESELPLWAHSGTGASTGRSWIWYLHNPQGVQLQHRCLWQLKLVIGMGRCFKAFYTESALFESGSILSASCRRNLTLPRRSHWSWSGVRVQIWCAYTVILNWYSFVNQKVEYYLKLLQGPFISCWLLRPPWKNLVWTQPPRVIMTLLICLVSKMRPAVLIWPVIRLNMGPQLFL